MRRTALVILLAASIGRAEARAADPDAAFASSIQAIITAQPLRHALWGILIEDGDGTILFEHNADKRLAPASTGKLFTAVSAAECLGLDARIPTELWLNGTVEGGTLHGDAVIRGYGDPSLGGRYEADRDASIVPLVRALQARGIHRIEGGVVADVSAFDRETIPTSWEWGDLGTYYAAPVDALAFNENVVGVLLRTECPVIHATADPAFVDAAVTAGCAEAKHLRILANPDNDVVIDGTMPDSNDLTVEIGSVPDPGFYAAQALDDLLGRSGIDVRDPPRVEASPRPWSEHVATVESPPLFLLLSTVLENSQNLYAEMLFKDLSRGEEPASYDASAAIEQRLMADTLGVGEGEIRFVDGSGLSAKDYVTPAALMRLVRYISAEQRIGIWSAILAEPGEGTLKRRFLDIGPRLRAKTGSTSSIAALAGWVDGVSGGRRSFVILLNHHIGPYGIARAAVDRIVEVIADF